MYIYISLSTPRSDDQLQFDQHPPIDTEVSNDPVIKQSDDMIMSRNAAYLNNSTWLKPEGHLLNGVYIITLFISTMF